MKHGRAMGMRRRSLVKASAASMALLALTACSSSGSLAPDETPADAQPKRITINVSAANDINPGPSGSPAPLAMQIYTLRSAGRFGTLDYFALRDSGASTLASDIVDQRSFSIRPGETREVVLNATDATALAVAAGFRAIDNARWRAITSIDEDSDTFAVSAQAASVSASRR